jgi:tetratricopeptide (TPR) repeat protein
MRRALLLAQELAKALIPSVILLMLAGGTYAVAQSTRDFFNLFNAMMRAAVIERVEAEWRKLPRDEFVCIDQRLQQQGGSTRDLIDRGVTPGDPRLSGLRVGCGSPTARLRTARLPAPEREAVERQDVSARPTFDCFKAVSPTASIICLDPGGAKADWDLTSAYWARSFSLVGTARDRFQQAHDEWFPALTRSCGLQAGQAYFSAAQRQCVLTAYRRRAQSYRSQLRDDALVEASLSPEQHVAIQQALITRNYLHADPDGEFGPVTRAAIKRFQAGSGFPERDFLSAAQRQILLQGEPEGMPSGPRPSPPEPPQPSAQEALIKCESKDANERFDGCTTVINAKGFGSKKTLVDALDGRCWASNVLKQYERALADCKEAIVLNSRYFHAHDNLGEALLGLGNIPNSIAAFTKAIELKPDFIYSRFGRAQAYVASANKELARKDYEYVLTIDPNNSTAKEGIRALAIETQILRDARTFLSDAQKFIEGQTAVDRLAEIARAAASLRGALDDFDEREAIEWQKKLSDLLEPINGFRNFLRERQAHRDQDEALRGDIASAEAKKNIYFVDDYIRRNLVGKRTDALLKMREQLDAAVRSQSLDQLNTTNGTFQTYIKDSGLHEEYETVTRNAPIRTPPITPTEKNRFAIIGPEEDVILIYNVSPSAPSVAKDIRGKFIFLTGTASLCFAQSMPDEHHVWFVERLLHDQGAVDVNREMQPCDLPRDAASIDIIAFTRGELRKQRREYILEVVNLLENDIFSEYRIVTETEYATDLQERRALSLEIAQQVERNERRGYGVLSMTDAPTPACIVTPSHAVAEGLKKLLSDQRVKISLKLLPNWQFVDMKVEDAFIALMKQQCGYVAGEESALRSLMSALRRERKLYEFAPLWFETGQVDAVSAELIRKEQQQQALAKARVATGKARKDAVELKLRKENGPRANALRDRIHNLIHDLPRDAAEKAGRRAVEGEHLFPQYLTWLNKRFADQWETAEVTSEVDEFGAVEWNGRPLDGVIVKTMVKQRNRIRGVNETDCFLFGLVDDVEFAMQRDPFALQCDGSDRAITNWKVRRQFASKWNWEPGPLKGPSR